MKAFKRNTNLPLKAALFLIIGLSPLCVARLSLAQSTDMAEKVMRRHQMLNPSVPAPGQNTPVSTPQNPPAGTAAQAPPTVSVACVPDAKLALSCKTVMIDPGHGGFQAGAVRGKFEEKNITLSVSLKLADLLKAEGATVIMTRTTDVAVSLHDRAEMSNHLKPDIFVSVHVNANTDNAIHGVETYYFTNEGAVLSQNLLTAMSGGLHEQANWSRWEELFVLDWNTQVAALAEVGYLSHANSQKNLVQDAYQQKIAQALCTGIENYFKAVPVPPTPAVLPMPVPSMPPATFSPATHVHEANVF
jgi:N-acetylmuramoyl-L-alanine amidase